MPPIEIEIWDQEVRNLLPENPDAPFSKKQQQDLASVLQKWAAKCIESRLRQISPEDEHEIHFRGKQFLGGIRKQEVDVWIWDEHAGLILAVDPKHFQSQDSFRKNWQNGLNDLMAFSTNLHERFPMAATGGVITFPEWAASESDRRKIHEICKRSVPREKPLNAYGKFEGFALAIYSKDKDLIWPYPERSPLRPETAFSNLASVVYDRAITLL